jgi:hypothetical protein
MLKTGYASWGIAVFVALLLGGCGYIFPHVYEGPHKVIYMPTWKNRTNKLELDMKIYQSLARWFQKSESVDLTKVKSGADLVLAGEILSVDLPSVSWNTVSVTTLAKINLHVRYVLQDLKTGKILWEVPDKLYTADFTVAPTTVTSDDEALAKIIEDMSEEIYLGALNRIRKQNKKTAAPN